YNSDRVPNENTLPMHATGCTTDGTPGKCFLPGDPGVQAGGSQYWLAGRRQPTKFVQTPFTQVPVSPIFPPPDGVQAGFNGDYSGIAVVGNRAHPIWSDTRNSAVVTSPTQGVVHDEDVFTDSRSIPGGQGQNNDDNNQDNGA